MATKFTVQQSDLTSLPSDLLLLKYANGFHGADMEVAELLTAAGACTKVEISPRPDDFVIVQSSSAMAPLRVMFLGTPPLRDFSYSQMRYFARRAIEVLAAQGLSLERMTTTVHGVNYGLDASEALQNLVRGFQDGLAQYPQCRIGEIAFVEKRERTARILKAALDALGCSAPAAQAGSDVSKAQEPQPRPLPEMRKPPAQAGADLRPRTAVVKKHVFVAMPFSEEFQDIYEFGIYGPIRRCGFICERVDEPSFTGDILQRITERISTAEFVIAELSGARANVYLEVGYAWGKGIPVIALAREGEKLHFDVSTQRCIFYRTIGQLSKELEKLIRGVYRCQAPEV